MNEVSLCSLLGLDGICYLKIIKSQRHVQFFVSPPRGLLADQIDFEEYLISRRLDNPKRQQISRMFRTGRKQGTCIDAPS